MDLIGRTKIFAHIIAVIWAFLFSFKIKGRKILSSNCYAKKIEHLNIELLKVIWICY
jgi:hypothetical protein